MSETGTQLKRCAQVFAVGIVLATLGIGPVAIQKGWVLWPAVSILIADIAISFAAIDYMAGQWVEADDRRRSPVPGQTANS